MQENCEVLWLRTSVLQRYIRNCETRNEPEKFRDFRETGPRDSGIVTRIWNSYPIPLADRKLMTCTSRRNTFAVTVSLILVIRRVAKRTRTNRKEMILMTKMTSVAPEVHHDLGVRYHNEREPVRKWPALAVSRSVRRFRCVKYHKYFECVCHKPTYTFSLHSVSNRFKYEKVTSRRYFTPCNKEAIWSSFGNLLGERKDSNQGNVM